MSQYDIVRAWKDPDVRDVSHPAAHPAGEIVLPEREPVGGMFMAAMILAASGTESLGTSGCCYCDCGCGAQTGCNREACAAY
jgi:mersacidin/lichenicidin family type 2 lantibiotic